MGKRALEPRIAHPALEVPEAAEVQSHIVHVMTRYLRGGSEKRLRDMVRALPDASHELIVGDESSPETARHEVGLTSVRVVPTLVRQPSPLRDARALVTIHRIIRDAAPDLVVTHQSKAGVLGRLAARKLRVPSLHSLSMANFGPGYPAWQSRVFRAVERALRSSTQAYAVVGHDLAHRYEEIGVAQNKLHVVRSGVRLLSETDHLLAPDEVRLRSGIPAGRPLIAYLGSLEPRKHVMELLTVLRDLPAREGPGPFLAIAGEGPLAGELANAIRTWGLQHDAALLGFVEDPLSFVAAADVVVLLSEAEGVSQVLVQAAALDTPYVAYDVDGVSELLRMGARGRAVALGDVGRAKLAVNGLLRLPRPKRPPAIDLRGWSPSAISRAYQDIFVPILDEAKAARTH
jgi:glycosyltransferase involved in cell wall biosynthesis